MRSDKIRRTAPAIGRERREKVEFLLRELDRLEDQAKQADMPMAARIFYTAKEELVHWAVTMRFHESAEDRFINRRLYAGHGKV